MIRDQFREAAYSQYVYFDRSFVVSIRRAQLKAQGDNLGAEDAETYASSRVLGSAPIVAAPGVAKTGGRRVSPRIVVMTRWQDWREEWGWSVRSKMEMQ